MKRVRAIDAAVMQTAKAWAITLPVETTLRSWAEELPPEVERVIAVNYLKIQRASKSRVVQAVGRYVPRYVELVG